MVDIQGAVLALLPWYIRWPLKLLGGIGGVVANVAAWLWRNPWRALAIASLLAFAWAWHGWTGAEKWGRQQQKLGQHWKIKFVDQRAEMRKIPGMLRERFEEAARLDRENAARVKREQAAHIERITHDFQKDRDAALAALRSRLRGEGTDSGASVRCEGNGGAANVPVLSDLSQGTGGALRTGGLAIVDEDDALICTANSLRLKMLIDAWDNAANVDVNGAEVDRPSPVQ